MLPESRELVGAKIGQDFAIHLYHRGEFLALVHALAWLEKRREAVPCVRPSVVHWDFHPNNILVREDGSAVVIDWTQVYLVYILFALIFVIALIALIVYVRRLPIFQAVKLGETE